MDKNEAKANKNLQGRITSLSVKTSVDRNNIDNFINPNINNQYIKKPRCFSKDRCEDIQNLVEKDRDVNIGIRERSNDNFAL